jgi:hypothetical protein
MGTPAYIFSPTETVPTARELISWTAGKGYQLKINPELFEDEDEEQELIADILDSADWKELGFENENDQWVLEITAQRKDDPNAYFQETMDDLKVMVADAKRSNSLDAVRKHRNSTQLLFDIQVNVQDKEVFPTQDIVISYFLENLKAIALLENTGAFIDDKRTIAKL